MKASSSVSQCRSERRLNVSDSLRLIISREAWLGSGGAASAAAHCAQCQVGREEKKNDFFFCSTSAEMSEGNQSKKKTKLRGR